MVIFAGLGFWLGKEADERLGWQPWATFAGLLFGCIVGFWSVCRRVMKWK
jgi:F0F1-type ATP synthase assembly protein I